MRETVQIPRDWIESVIRTLQGPLPAGRIGDVVFLLRDQLQDILDRPTRGHQQSGKEI